ncbi:hypothetical protein [Lentilactobacillus diolivorans]|nr:hypothetical protein [Lentilactobacillus diolivorans]GEP24176.1 hypothetical protein LDI01_17690 [Lentilactobacillus diolivorans]
MSYLLGVYPADYSANQFIQAFSFSNPHIAFNLVVAGLTFLFGYLEYMYSFALVIKERSAPYPIWMHTFYFAHDSMGAIVFALAAIKYHNFWLFWGASGALVIWNLFEVFNLYKAIYVERDAIWGHLYKTGKVSIKDAWIKVVSQLCIMIGVVNLFRVFMHDPFMFKWFIFTNVLIAIAPGLYWEERKTQVGASKGLAIVIILGTINSFLPTNMWALVSPMFRFNENPWFYILGAVAILYSVRAYFVYDRLAKKPQRLFGRKTVW